MLAPGAAPGTKDTFNREHAVGDRIPVRDKKTGMPTGVYEVVISPGVRKNEKTGVVVDERAGANALANYWNSPEGRAKAGFTPDNTRGYYDLPYPDYVAGAEGGGVAPSGSPTPSPAPTKAVLGPSSAVDPMAQFDEKLYTPATYAGLKARYGTNESSSLPPMLTGADGPANVAAYYTQQQNRIPGGAGLESQSSDIIMGLLNTPEGSTFSDTNRMAAERGAATGTSGSTNAFGVGIKMNDEERLKRIALGQNFLSAAYNRNPALDPSYQFMTPAQKAALDQDRERLDLQKKAQELENMLKLLQIRNLTPAVQKGTNPLDPGAFGTPGTKPAYVNPLDDYLKGMINFTG